MIEDLALAGIIGILFLAGVITACLVIRQRHKALPPTTEEITRELEQGLADIDNEIKKLGELYMGLVIFLGILLILGIAGLIAGILAMPKTITDTYGRQPVEKKNYWRTGTIIGSVVLIVVAPVIFLLSGIKSVPVKSVGVTTSFGRVGSEYGPGAHWMVPWKSLNIIQDTIQTDNYAQSNGTAGNVFTASGATGTCITVRLGGQQEGCADVQLQTQVEAPAIPDLFANYSSYGSDLTADIDQYVVYRDLKTVLNRTLGDYNPVADVSATLASTGTTSQFSQFDPALLSAMQADLAGQVNVLNFNLQYVHYDPATQDRINQITTQYADTQVAIQQEQTNKAISAANAALVQANSLSPAVLENECYTTTQDAIKAGYSLPTGWNCSGTSSSGLILNGK
jgi:regulator of protease activity HflC (stomatin/prohibitin superfamily)